MNTKFLLIIGCFATMMCFAQSPGETGGTTGTGATTGNGGMGTKKPFAQLVTDIGDPVIVVGGGKKQDHHRPAVAGRWQICTKACWTLGHVVAKAYAWYQPADIPCGLSAWPDEAVYYCEGYKLNGKLVITDSGWTDGDHMDC